MESIFSRTYSCGGREAYTDLNKYLIEILGFCFEKDSLFRDRFFKLIGHPPEEKITVYTQFGIPGLGMPDIGIRGSAGTTLIKCMASGKEKEVGLDSYVRVLEKWGSGRNTLVCLARNRNRMNIPNKHIQFVSLRWTDVYHQIDEACHPFTMEFKLFLEEKKITMNKDFTTMDLVTMEHFSGIISKMDEVILSVKPYFEEHFGKLTTDECLSNSFQKKGYYNFKTIGDPQKFDINLGFRWRKEKKGIYLGVSIWIPTNSEVIGPMSEFLHRHLSEWEVERKSSGFTIGSYLHLNRVVADSEDQMTDMGGFLLESIGQLVELKESEPQLFL